MCHIVGVAQPEQQVPAQAESIGIRELWRNASKYVEMAKAGRRVPVTEHGKLVAYLVPSEEATMTTTFQRMVAAGQVQRATRRFNLKDLGPFRRPSLTRARHSKN